MNTNDEDQDDSASSGGQSAAGGRAQHPDEKQKREFDIAKKRRTAKSFLDIDKEAHQEQQRITAATIAELNRKSEEHMARLRADRLNMRYQNLQGFPVDSEALVLLSEQESRDAEVLCILATNIEIRLATKNPRNPAIAGIITRLERSQGVKPQLALVSESSFKEGLEVYRHTVIKAKHDAARDTGSGSTMRTHVQKATTRIKSLEDLKQRLKQIPTSEIVDIIISAALEVDSSDIHIEPEEAGVTVRYRIDGVLQDVALLDKTIFPQLMSRIKLLSKLKLNLTQIPQDGRFEVIINDRKVDIRTSTLPSAFGESVVMRLLSTNAADLQITDLGLRKEDFDMLQQELGKPHGMILTTGPTGSGKTTTLYAFLNKINTPDIKVITIEDPIEYRLPGISQTQVDPARGYDFSSGLRAILRQDPDVIMVGEIRDLDTAEIAMQAALTGHLVFSTLHTNDSSGVIPRLINMGVRPFTIAPAINAVIAQRLIRRVCDKCATYTTPEPDLVANVRKELGALATDALVREWISGGADGTGRAAQPHGCSVCNNTGFRGRIGIYEIFRVTKEMEELILSAASTSEIRDLTIKNGMITMRQDGLLKLMQGITTLEEINRVT